MLRAFSRPIRTVLRWQLLATALLAAAAGMAAGLDGALSAAAGGAVSVLSGLAGALLAARGGKHAGGVVVGALRAEAVRIALIVFLLWLVMTAYRDVVALAFFGTFLVTVLIFAMAFFVRDYN